MRTELTSVIERIDWAKAREDVMRFVYASDRPSLDLWTIVKLPYPIVLNLHDLNIIEDCKAKDWLNLDAR